MRIIAGKHRSRTLLAPKGEEVTRPITDRAKENLFNRLQALGVLGEEELHGVADVFCGTGSLGLEALSRGADHCIFVDQDRRAIGLLRKNLDALGETDRAQTVEISAFVPVWLTPLKSQSLTLAFIDPPYALIDEEHTRRMILELIESLQPKLEPGGLTILRTRRSTPIPEQPDYDGPIISREGTSAIHLFQKPLP